MPSKARYKIQVSVEITKELVDVYDDGTERINYTGERIRIDDNISFGDAMTLVDALDKIRTIHEAVQPK